MSGSVKINARPKESTDSSGNFQGVLFLLAAATALMTLSCEDVIDVSLNSVEPRIVIEATITDQGNPAFVVISRTGDYFNPSDFPRVSGASVRISDDAGNTAVLAEDARGRYSTREINGVPGRTYTLTVDVEGQTYSATSMMPHPIEIDSLTYVYQQESVFRDEGYVVSCHFSDPEGVIDYCRFVPYVNGRGFEGYYLYDGQWGDGKSITFEWDGLELGDRMMIAVYSFDETVFDYFLTLDAVVATNDDSESIWSPANPNTNLSNDALGYFGAFAISSASIEIR